MSLHDYVIDNASGAAVRSDMNNAFAAIQSNNSNATSPTSTTPFMTWFDTTANELKIRDAGDTTWVSIFDLTGTTLVPFINGLLLGDASVETVGTAALNNLPNIEDIQNRQGIYAADDTGSADDYIIAPVPAIASYIEGQSFTFKVAVTNTGTSTLNVSGKGAITIKKNPGQVNLEATDFTVGDIVHLTYDGTFFQFAGIFTLPSASLASQAQAEAGTNDTKIMTPIRVADAQVIFSSQVFHSSDDYIVPPEISKLQVIIVGGGGGGGGGGIFSTEDGGGGGGGGMRIAEVVVTPGATLAVVIGTGGAGGSTYANGSTGEISTFGATLATANGGLGGIAGSGQSGGAGGEGGGIGAGGTVIAAGIGNPGLAGAIPVGLPLPRGGAGGFANHLGNKSGGGGSNGNGGSPGGGGGGRNGGSLGDVAGAGFKGICIVIPIR